MTSIRQILWLLLLLTFAGDLPSIANPGAEEPMVNAFCPVSPDEAIDPDISVEYEGVRVFFCCNRCRKKFLANPEKYREGIPQLADAHAHSHEAEAKAVDEHEHEESQAHDHAKDHGTSSAGPERLVKFLGKFHPLIVHFPVALILAALAAEGLFIWKKTMIFALGARLLISLGALGALAAAPLGWMAAAFVRYPAELSNILLIHRWLGVSVLLASLAAAILSRGPGIRPTRLRLYRFFLVLSAVLVSLAGHFGAMMVYGPDYFTW